MLKILDIVPSWAYAIAIVVLLLGYGLKDMALSAEVAAHSKTATAYAGYREEVAVRDRAATEVALAETERQRELERMRNKVASEADRVFTQEKSLAHQRIAAAADRERVLNDTIDVLTAPRPAEGGAGGGDTAAARRAEETAAALGGLLKTCRAEGRSDAEDLEGLAGQVRALIRRYESLLAPPATNELPAR